MNLKISNYHKKQYDKIYRSTELFLKFIETHEKLNNKVILDVGCGAGANTIYLAQRFPKSFIIGVDQNNAAINFARFMTKSKKINNCKFFNSNILNFNKKIKIDIILSFHFLSFTDVNYEKFLKKFCNLKAPSMAHSSLFFDGLVEAKINVKDFSKSELDSSPYNIISFPKVKKILKDKKYKFFTYSFMKLDRNLKKPKHNGMGSYTKKNKSGDNYIVSGPLHLPHGYFYCSK